MKTLHKARCPHIVEFIGAVSNRPVLLADTESETRADNLTLAFVQERVSVKSKSYLDSFTPSNIKWIMRQLLEVRLFSDVFSMHAMRTVAVFVVFRSLFLAIRYLP
jgi:hypothetical protein